MQFDQYWHVCWDGTKRTFWNPERVRSSPDGVHRLQPAGGRRPHLNDASQPAVQRARTHTHAHCFPDFLLSAVTFFSSSSIFFPFLSVFFTPAFPLIPSVLSFPSSLGSSLLPCCRRCVFFFFRSEFACRFRVFSSMSRPRYQT